jgi:hypothetical protein
VKPPDARSVSLGSELPIKHVTPEMVIRHTMAEMDKVATIVIAVTYKDGTGKTPVVLHSTNVSDYFLSFVGSVMLRLATRMMDGRN